MTMHPRVPVVSMRLVALLGLANLVTQQRRVLAQAESPAAAAFRDNARDIAARVRLAAEAMPATKYEFRPGPSQRSFAELLLDLSDRTDYLCSRLAGSRRPSRPALLASASADSLTRRLGAVFDTCDQTMATVTDAQLADTVPLGLHDGPEVRVSRALAMTLTTAYWADIYAQLATDLRLTGHAPPEVCRRGRLMWNLNFGCDSGFDRCIDAKGMRGASPLVLMDSGNSVRSDGRGPYRAGASGVVGVFGGPRVGMLAEPRGGGAPRAITVDLNNPVPGDIGVPRGVHLEDKFFEMEAQWYTEPDYIMHSLLDIPIGTAVTAAQIEVNFLLDGAVHVLQMGPQGGGHCYSDGTAIHGVGTTRGTVRRESEARWVVDLPSGSIGRLFDRHLGDPNAINKGLYFVSLHFVVGGPE